MWFVLRLTDYVISADCLRCVEHEQIIEVALIDTKRVKSFGNVFSCVIERVEQPTLPLSHRLNEDFKSEQCFAMARTCAHQNQIAGMQTLI
jgi:hypothetical protein